MSINRRSFLCRSGWLAAGSVSFPAVVRAAGAGGGRAGEGPRHIIHMVADGMSHGTFTCADHFSWVTRKRGLAWAELTKRPGVTTALMNMRSLNALVTDSAAASSSWGCGSRVKNGALNVLPDGRELRPLCSVLGEAGWQRGLVTTTEITHATPAGFAVNTSDRGTADGIAAQYLARRLDVLLGGGQQYFDPAKRKDKRDLWAEFRQAGYEVMLRRGDLLKAATRRRWLGTFYSGHLPFTIDRRADEKLIAQVPTLAEMTRVALSRLEGAPRFLLQVEGGRVDHAAHASDAAAAMHDMLAFDEAIEVCLDFQRRVPETLMVITTDHGNANLGLNGTGSDYVRSSPALASLAKVKKSLNALVQDIKAAAGPSGVVRKYVSDELSEVIQISPADLARVIGDATGYSVSARRAGMLARYLAGDWVPLNDQYYSPHNLLGQLLGNYCGIGWTGSSHTADYVLLTAAGPGAARFHGLVQNTDIFPTYMDFAGIQFKNAEARLIAHGGPSAADAERWTPAGTGEG